MGQYGTIIPHRKRSSMSRQKLFPNEKVIKINLRMPESLKEKILEQAVPKHHSLNQEIVALLEEALQLREKQQSVKDQ